MLLNRPHLLLTSLLIWGCLVTASPAEDLMEVYSLAENSDPQFRQIAATKRAVLEQRPQALSQLLPNVSFNARTTSNDQDITSAFIVGGSSSANDIRFNSRGYSLDLTQPIVRMDRWVRLGQANSRIRQADAELGAAQQDLMVRVAAAYFGVLAALDDLAFADAEEKSLSRQLEQAKQRFDVGLTAITDVQEAQAGYDRAVAQKITAGNAVDNAREALREITGEYIPILNPLGGEMPLVTPEPNQIDAWTETALLQNLDVQANQYAVDTARREIKVQLSGHLPTLDLVARRSFDKTGGRFGDTRIDATAVGLELNVPLFQGGFVSSRAREARQRLDQQLERLEQARRRAQRQTRESFLGVISGISQVKAFKQALVSSETALQATEAGFEVGTRTAVDVVAAQRGTFQARRDYARARYNFILDSLRLKRAAGTLSQEDLAHVSRWLN